MRSFCAEYGLPYPVTTDNPVLLEILPTAERARHGADEDTHFRNLPERTYTLFLDVIEPKMVVEMLAFYACEWEAQEIAKAIRD